MGKLNSMLIRTISWVYKSFDLRQNAVDMYMLSAAQGFHDAEFDLAMAYVLERGTGHLAKEQCNDESAKRLINLAAEGGNLRAKSFLACREKDPEERMRLLQEIAEAREATIDANKLSSCAIF